MPDDTALMLRYQNGDLAAFDELYGRHRSGLYRYLLRQCGDPDTAADLFQEAWSRVIRASGRYQPRARFSTYLYRIAHNCFIDFCRRHGRDPIARSAGSKSLDELPGFERPPDQRAELSELMASFRDALESLPSEQREVVLLYEEAGLNLDQISVATGAGRETVKSRLRYALKKLRAALRDKAERVTESV